MKNRYTFVVYVCDTPTRYLCHFPYTKKGTDVFSIGFPGLVSYGLSFILLRFSSMITQSHSKAFFIYRFSKAKPDYPLRAVVVYSFSTMDYCDAEYIGNVNTLFSKLCWRKCNLNESFRWFRILFIFCQPKPVFDDKCNDQTSSCISPWKSLKTKKNMIRELPESTPRNFHNDLLAASRLAFLFIQLLRIFKLTFSS